MGTTGLVSGTVAGWALVGALPALGVLGARVGDASGEANARCHRTAVAVT